MFDQEKCPSSSLFFYGARPLRHPVNGHGCPAAACRIRPGNVSRRIKRALEKIYMLVKQHATDEFGEKAANDMLGEIMKNKKTFASALLEAFAEIQEDRS